MQQGLKQWDIVRGLIKYNQENKEVLLHQNEQGETVLMSLALFNQKDLVKYLANKIPQLLALADIKGNTPLMYAIFGGHSELVKPLLTKEVFSQFNYWGESALSLAVQKRDGLLVKLMIDEFAKNLNLLAKSVYHKNSAGKTPFRQAIEQGDLASVESLYDNILELVPPPRTQKQFSTKGENAEISQALKYYLETERDNLGNLLLHDAAAHPEVYSWLSKLLNVSPDKQLSLTGDSPAHFAASLGKVETVLGIEKTAGGKAWYEFENFNKETPLFAAVKKNQVDFIQAYHKAGGDLEHKNRQGIPAIMLAVSREPETFNALCQLGASLDFVEPSYNRTTLHIAANMVQKKVVDFYPNALKEKHANMVDSLGNVPLFYAAKSGNEELVKSLLPITQNYESLLNNQKETLTHCLAEGGCVESLTQLVEKDTKICLLRRDKSKLSPLHKAALHGQAKVLAYAISILDDVWEPLNHKTEFGDTVLSLLVSAPDSVQNQLVISDLLANGAEVDTVNQQGLNALHVSASLGRELAFSALLGDASSAALEAKDNIGRTVLHYIAQGGYLSLLEQMPKASLLRLLNEKDEDGNTALLLALSQGHTEVADHLLELGAPVTSQNKEGLCPLHLAFQSFDSIEMHSWVTKAKEEQVADLEYLKTQSGLTPFLFAVLGGQIETVQAYPALHRYLSSREIDRPLSYWVKQQEVNRVPSLLLAAINDDKRLFDSLCEAGANIYAKNKEGETILHRVCRAGSETILGELINNPDIDFNRLNTVDNLGRTPLAQALQSGQLSTFLKLIPHVDASELTRADNNEMTPFHYAAMQCSPAALQTLYSAIPEKKRLSALQARAGKVGDTPLILASRQGCARALVWLLDRGVDINEISNYYETPLTVSAEKGNVELIQFMVNYAKDHPELTLDVNKADGKWHSAKRYAETNGFHNIVALLENEGAVDNWAHSLPAWWNSEPNKYLKQHQDFINHGKQSLTYQVGQYVGPAVPVLVAITGGPAAAAMVIANQLWWKFVFDYGVAHIDDYSRRHLPWYISDVLEFTSNKGMMLTNIITNPDVPTLIGYGLSEVSPYALYAITDSPESYPELMGLSIVVAKHAPKTVLNIRDRLFNNQNFERGPSFVKPYKDDFESLWEHILALDEELKKIKQDEGKSLAEYMLAQDDALKSKQQGAVKPLIFQDVDKVTNWATMGLSRQFVKLRNKEGRHEVNQELKKHIRDVGSLVQKSINVLQDEDDKFREDPGGYTIEKVTGFENTAKNRLHNFWVRVKDRVKDLGTFFRVTKERVKDYPKKLGDLAKSRDSKEAGKLLSATLDIVFYRPEFDTWLKADWSMINKLLDMTQKANQYLADDKEFLDSLNNQVKRYEKDPHFDNMPDIMRKFHQMPSGSREKALSEEIQVQEEIHHARIEAIAEDYQKLLNVGKQEGRVITAEEFPRVQSGVLDKLNKDIFAGLKTDVLVQQLNNRILSENPDERLAPDADFEKVKVPDSFIKLYNDKSLEEGIQLLKADLEMAETQHNVRLSELQTHVDDVFDEAIKANQKQLSAENTPSIPLFVISKANEQLSAFYHSNPHYEAANQIVLNENPSRTTWDDSKIFAKARESINYGSDASYLNAARLIVLNRNKWDVTHDKFFWESELQKVSSALKIAHAQEVNDDNNILEFNDRGRVYRKTHKKPKRSGVTLRDALHQQIHAGQLADVFHDIFQKDRSLPEFGGANIEDESRAGVKNIRVFSERTEFYTKWVLTHFLTHEQQETYKNELVSVRNYIYNRFLSAQTDGKDKSIGNTEKTAFQILGMFKNSLQIVGQRHGVKDLDSILYPVVESPSTRKPNIFKETMRNIGDGIAKGGLSIGIIWQLGGSITLGPVWAGVMIGGVTFGDNQRKTLKNRKANTPKGGQPSTNVFMNEGNYDPMVSDTYLPRDVFEQYRLDYLDLETPPFVNRFLRQGQRYFSILGEPGFTPLDSNGFDANAGGVFSHPSFQNEFARKFNNDMKRMLIQGAMSGQKKGHFSDHSFNSFGELMQIMADQQLMSNSNPDIREAAKQRHDARVARFDSILKGHFNGQLTGVPINFVGPNPYEEQNFFKNIGSAFTGNVQARRAIEAKFDPVKHFARGAANLAEDGLAIGKGAASALGGFLEDSLSFARDVSLYAQEAGKNIALYPVRKLKSILLKEEGATDPIGQKYFDNVNDYVKAEIRLIRKGETPKTGVLANKGVQFVNSAYNEALDDLTKYYNGEESRFGNALSDWQSKSLEEKSRLMTRAGLEVLSPGAILKGAKRSSAALRSMSVRCGNLPKSGAPGLGAGYKAGVGIEKALRRQIDPTKIRFSQTSISQHKPPKLDAITGRKEQFTFDSILADMKKNGWKGAPIDVVKMPDGGLTTIDNTRLLAARQAGIEAKVKIHQYGSELPKQYIDRFYKPGKPVPKTWGEAITLRINDQPTPGYYRGLDFSKEFPLGSLYDPVITKGKPKL